MSVVFTTIASVKDWSALRRLNRETLIRQAREAGATQYRLLRNVNDASEVIVLAELPDYEAAQELGKIVAVEMAPLLEGIGEPIAWEDINREEEYQQETASPVSTQDNDSSIARTRAPNSQT